MAGITLAQAEAKLTLWLAAEEACAAKQSFELPDGRKLTYADLKTIHEMVESWDAKVQKLDRGGIRIRGAVPVT